MPSFISRLAQSQMDSPLEMIGADMFRQSSTRFGDVHLDTEQVSGPTARNANIPGAPQGQCFGESETVNAS